jgi:hypothetical protein
MLFRDRRQAGSYLATKLAAYANQPTTVVLALPRGGVPVGFEVAKALHAPLDVFVVRKLGVPGQEELAMGATATGKVRVLNQEVIRELSISQETVEAVVATEERLSQPLPHFRRRVPFLQSERPHGPRSCTIDRSSSCPAVQQPLHLDAEGFLANGVPIGLDLRVGELKLGHVAMLAGGDSGPAVEPGRRRSGRQARALGAH